MCINSRCMTFGLHCISPTNLFYPSLDFSTQELHTHPLTSSLSLSPLSPHHTGYSWWISWSLVPPTCRLLLTSKGIRWATCTTHTVLIYTHVHTCTRTLKHTQMHTHYGIQDPRSAAPSCLGWDGYSSFSVWLSSLLSSCSHGLQFCFILFYVSFLLSSLVPPIWSDTWLPPLFPVSLSPFSRFSPSPRLPPSSLSLSSSTPSSLSHQSKFEEDTPFGRVARPFFNGNDDEFRNNRFKLIPKVRIVFEIIWLFPNDLITDDSVILTMFISYACVLCESAMAIAHDWSLDAS